MSKEIRNRLGLKQEDMAAFLGITRSLYSLVELGLRRMPLRAQKILNGLQLSELKVSSETLREIKPVYMVKSKWNLEDYLFKINSRERHLRKLQIRYEKFTHALNVIQELQNIQSNGVQEKLISWKTADLELKITDCTYAIRKLTEDIKTLQYKITMLQQLAA